MPATRIKPREDLITISIPDATPELIRVYALDDEQALLAIVRYNRLIDTFLGLTTYSLQNHLRTTVKRIGPKSRSTSSTSDWINTAATMSSPFKRRVGKTRSESFKLPKIFDGSNRNFRACGVGLLLLSS